MFNQIMKSNKSKLLNFLLIIIFSLIMVVPAQALNGDGTGTGGGAGSGTNPLTFLGANITTTNHLTESDPLKQISTPGVSIIDNNSVPSGPQSIDISIDKNIITDIHYDHNQSCITLKDVTTSSNKAISFFRLGATDGSGIYKQHIYFDVNLQSAHKYELKIDGSLMANNGLTLLTTKTVDFTTSALVPTPTSTRLAGVTAAQTAVKIADETGWTGKAILASSTSYGMVDALTAGPLATFLKAPILMTESGNILNTDTKAELSKLNVKTVYVTSGTGVISQAVLDQLKGMGITVESLGGVDRFDTSAKIAQKMVTLGATVSKVAVAYGWKNQDALSIASIASAQTEPILLTEKDAIPTNVKAFLTTNTSVKTTDVIGGTGVISEAVKAQLPSATRQSGNTAYDTNVAVLKAFDSVLKYDHVFVANGETAIDALAGAPLAAKYNAGIVLTNGTTNEGMTYVSGKLSAASEATALGGTAVVPDSVLW